MIVHLLGKRILASQAISEDVFACVDQIIFSVYEKTQIDFQTIKNLKPH